VPLGGKEFGAYRLVFGDDGIDLWDREGTPLYDDLARRDFTVNAFAWDLHGGEVVDPFGGLADLERRQLRATTEKSFVDDPLRLLRLPRLLLRLPGFTADPATVELGRLAAALLPRVAAERIRDEVAKLFDHPEARRGVEMLAALDLYPGLWLGRPGEPGDATPAVVLLDSLAGSTAVLEGEAAPEVLGVGWHDGLRAARLAATFLPLPSPIAAVLAWSEAGYLSRKEAETVNRLLAETAIPEGEIEMRRFLYRTGESLWAAALALLGARAEIAGEGSRWRAAAEAVLALVSRHGQPLFSPPRLVSGLDVQRITGLPPGPALGQVIAALNAEQVDGRILSREEAERWLERQDTISKP
jgi:tRNA nucleotidyltransferase/poly(A) polymerase